MQGHYPGNRGVRLHGDSGCGDSGCEPRDAPSARLFLCADCRAQALICGCCDRGQIYCAGDCARRARRRKQNHAGRRYQTSRLGRLAHADRARRYRARRNKVTHQGSPQPPTDDLLSRGSPAMASDAVSSDERLQRVGSHCHWCGRRCPDLVRHGFLRRRLRRPRPPRHLRAGPDHGDCA